jgi:hypothetical protein
MGRHSDRCDKCGIDERECDHSCDSIELERLTAQIKEYYVAQDNMLAYNSSDEDIDRFNKVDNALRELVNMQIEGER